MKIRLAVLLLLLAVVGAGMSWLTGTTRGTRFALDTVIRVIPAKVELGRVEGRLLYRLSIEHVRIEWKDGDVRIEGLTIRWKPWMVFLRNVAIDEISLRKIAVTEGKTDEPTTFEWPEIPWYLSWFRGSVKDLRAGTVSYRELPDEPYSFEDLAATIDWQFGILQAEKIRCTYERDRITGSIRAGFTRPLLNGHLMYHPSDTSGPVRQVELKLKLSRGKVEGMAGPVDVRLSLAPKRSFSFTGDLALLHSRLDISKGRIQEEGRKGTVEADGSIEYSEPYKGRLSLVFAGLDLSKEFAPLGNLSGKVVMEGNLSAYEGQFEAANKTPGVAQGVLAGTCKGTQKELSVEISRGTFLEGSVTGKVKVDQGEKTKISASLAARKLNPGVVARQWKGSVNGDMEGSVILARGQPPEIAVKASLHKSVVMDKPVEGVIDASLRGTSLAIARLDLHGQGFDLSAHGLLHERVDYTAHIRNIALFVPDAHGSVEATGWARWKEGKAAGAVKAVGRDINFQQFKAPSVKADVDLGIGGSVNGKIQADNPEYGSLRLKALSASIEGTTKEHSLKLQAGWLGGKADLALSGGYDKESWDGQIRTLFAEGRQGGLSLDRPAAFSLSRKAIAVGPLSISGSKGEKMDMQVNLTLKNLEGFVTAKWDRIDLARASALLPDPQKISGRASGNLRAEWHGGNMSNIAGEVHASALLTDKAFSVEITPLNGMVRWSGRGLAASLDGKLSPSGQVKGVFTSNEAIHPGLPRSADFSLSWEGLDVKMARPFLPQTIAANGSVSGSVKGRLVEGAVDATGETRVSGGLLAYKTENGIISAELNTAKAGIVWRNAGLSGDMDLALADHGRLQGTFLIPLRARLPFSLDPAGPVKLSLSGSVREKGLLTALFPGLVRESHGRLTLNASASGTWEHPRLTGSLKLSDGGAFLPAAGITLKQASAQVDFSDDRLTLTSFQIRSGDGTIDGKGTVRLSSLKPAEFDISLTGREFQAVYLPELRVKVDPDLTIKGAAEKLVIRGSITVPEASLTRIETQAVKASSDVRIVDRPAETRKPVPLKVDAAIDVVLGKKVTVSAEGINATLGGKVTVSGESIDDIRTKGEIEITKGYYRAYSVRLDIERGKIRFAGGPPESGRLDILALRKITETKPGEIKPTDIKAGVLVTGPVRSPVINLYSIPTMADTDILSYMVLGGPLQQNASQTGALFQAAEALLPGGQSTSLKDRLQGALGVSTLGVETRSQQAGTTQSILAVGKYLTPRLYVSMGRALLTNESVVTMRLTLSRHWELLSQTGTQSGAGLYYKVEFD